jgi:hypothetical protein
MDTKTQIGDSFSSNLAFKTQFCVHQTICFLHKKKLNDTLFDERIILVHIVKQIFVDHDECVQVIEHDL